MASTKPKGLIVGMDFFDEKKKKETKEKTADEFFGAAAEGVDEFDFSAILEAAESTTNSIPPSPSKDNTPITPLSAVPASLRENATGSNSSSKSSSPPIVNRDSVASATSSVSRVSASGTISSPKAGGKRLPTDDEVQTLVSLISQGAKRATIVAKIENDNLDPVETFAAIAFASIPRPNGGSQTVRSESPSRGTNGRSATIDSIGSLSSKTGGGGGSNSFKSGSSSLKGKNDDASKASIAMTEFFSPNQKSNDLVAAFSSGKDDGEEFEMPTPFLAVAEEKMIAKMTEQQAAKPSLASSNNNSTGGWFGTSFKTKPTSPTAEVGTSPVVVANKKNAVPKPAPRPSKIPKDFSPANFGDMYGGGKKDDDDFGFDNPLTKGL